MSCAIVTVAIGDAYARIASITHPLMERYAKRTGCQFVVIDKYDGPDMYMSKFLVGSLFDKYERILFLDTDVLVRGDCPSLFDMVPLGVFGAFDEHLLANNEEKSIHKKFMGQAQCFYGIQPGRFCFFNTGVMVLSRCHASLLEQPSSFLSVDYYDQLLVNLRLGASDFATHDIGYKFNRMQYVEGRVPGTRLDCFIIHYAGIQKCLSLIKADYDRWLGG